MMTNRELTDYRKLRNTSLLAVILPLLVWVAGCGPGKKELSVTDRKTMVTNLTKEVIVPAFETFLKATDSLAAAGMQFGTAPGKANLESMRAHWLLAAQSWKKAATFSFGPVDDEFLGGGIDYTGVHYPNIEKIIASSDPIDSAFVESRGSSLKGLKAIEYLLFNRGDTALSDLSSSPRRMAYLAALTQNLNVQAKKVVDAWTKGSPSYAEKFSNADGKDLKSALNILVNQCISRINMIKDERLAVPLGMRNEGNPRPDLVEGRLSGSSVLLLRSELEGLRSIFNSGGKDYLNSLLDQLDAQYNGKPLSEAIAAHFETADRQAAGIPADLEKAITQNTDPVRQLYDSLKKLQILLEVDVVNQLGVIMTFSDNDGD